MSDPQKDKFSKLKDEADQVLFENIDFNEEMKEKVRARTNQLNKRKLFAPIGNGRRLTAIAAVAAVVLVSLSTLIFHNGGSNLTENGTSEFSTFSSDAPNSNVIGGSNELKKWEVKTQDEVRQFFPEVLLPSYTVDAFQQERIQLQGKTKEDVDRVVFTYVLNNISYIIIVEKDEGQLKPVGFDHVDMNGATGYLNAEKDMMELHFYKENYHYMINGMISQDEALKIARSFK